ncbi:MAG: hypothetical protein WCG21_09680 [Eubacteriales bacterium]
MDPLVVTLIVIGIVLVVVGTLVVNVLRVIRSLRSAANSKAVQIVSEIAEELLSGNAGNIPADLLNSRQPRSVSDMTSVYAPMLARDFPDLNLNQLISSAENKLCSALYAIQEGSADGAGLQTGTSEYAAEKESNRDDEEKEDHLFLGATPDFAAQIQRQIAALTAEDRIEYFEKIKIHRTGIKAYQKNAGTCVITLQTAIEYLHYIKQNGVVVSGSQQTVEQDRYDLSIIYVLDESQLPSSSTNAVSVNCPNCGAPVKGLGIRHCEFCGSSIQAIDIRIWRINQFILS